MNVIHADIAIIGAGAGGLSLAAGASQLGARVVLLESGKMGGDCLNYGCVPSKALLKAAHAVNDISSAKKFGVTAASVQVDFEKVMQHVHKAMKHIAKHDSVKRFQSLGVEVIKGAGQFIDEKTVKTGKQKICAKRFVIATGSSPFIPPIPGLDKVQYETNESIFNLKSLPKHLVVIGGGPIGCELAQAFALLGSKVILLEMFKLLPKDDADAVALLRERLVQQGIEIHEGINIKAVHAARGGKIIVEADKDKKSFEVKGTHLLVATGRRANVNGLDLKAAGIAFSERGVEVDARLRTSNRKVYAIGDVTGGIQLTHVANYHTGIVLKNILFRLPAKVDYGAIPWVTYTNPEVAHVGLLHEAVGTRRDICVTEAFFSDNDRAIANSETDGKIKVLSNKKGRVLGVTIVGAGAGELILPWVVAVREKRTLRMFTDTVVPYPTLSEISKRVSGAFYTPKLFSDTTRMIVRCLLKLG